jgi:tRNA threonylcarbamoyladenosine biosynthesis protein TsaE
LIKISLSENDTLDFGREFAAGLLPNDFIALYGELGAGKTAFTRGLCQGLGCTIDAHSPTFNIVNIYPGLLEVVHIDLYRVESNIEEIGWTDLIESGRVVIVEWAEKAKKELPRKRFDIYFEVENQNERQIRIEQIDDSGN